MKRVTEKNISYFFENVLGDDLITSSLPLGAIHKTAFDYGFFIEQIGFSEFRVRQMFDEKRLSKCKKLIGSKPYIKKQKDFDNKKTDIMTTHKIIDKFDDAF